MIANVFIYAIDDEAAKTLVGIPMDKGHDLERVLPFIQNERHVERLKSFYPDGQCYLWGVQEKEDNLATWAMMVPDDLVLGYCNRAIMSAARVLMTANNPALAIELWGPIPGGPYGLLCFSDKPHVGEVPIVPQMLRYLDLDYEGFTRLDPEKCKHMVQDYGSLDVFVRLGLRYDFPFNFRHSE
ncbi:MAG TPA: hypothetical protein VMB77_09045 [Syntrophales bacterium]|nr:hypothetical protein [Syntrophales bacterium]